MSGWYSNIVGATTSRITNLQRSYFSGETDGDTEDDTHVCRVLRSYYTEKGKPFPGWLPPDPKAPPPAAAVYAQPSQVGARYGGMGQQQGPGGGSLSSLWDNNPSTQAQEAPQSLRRGRGAPGGGGGGGGMRNSGGRDSPFGNADPFQGDTLQARPLPSQRAGSYQTGGGAPTPPAGLGAGSAQDRLKQRLFGGARTASPTATGGGPFNPPPQQRGGGGSGDYEDRFAPGGMYDNRSGRGGSGGGGDIPQMSANAPWSDNGYNMPGSGGGRRPGGLPSGPRMR
ncbi:Sec1-binding region of Mso1-domain-containing protein [Astrocystis sublimbata]|nr:Sec1-binding region of Mso1-domain-containing protein [Astrocystis sublimbata]